jgi:hypothetical protein
MRDLNYAECIVFVIYDPHGDAEVLERRRPYSVIYQCQKMLAVEDQ